MYEIFKSLFAIAKVNGVNLAIYDSEIFIIKEVSRDFARLISLSDQDREIVIYDPENLITYNKLTKSVFNRLRTGIETEQNRNWNGTESELERNRIGTGTEQNRNWNGTESELERTRIGTESEQNRNWYEPGTAEVIGEGKVNLKKFSVTCPESCKGTSESIEVLLERILKNTNKKTTIENLIKLHQQAAQFAHNDNIFKLKQIESRLKGIANKQNAIKASEETIRKKNRRRNLLVKISTSIAVASLAFFLISQKIKNEAPHRSYSTLTSSIEVDLFTACCDQYERDTGRKIYPAGRECLKRACSGIEDKEKILEIIKENMK